MHDEKNNLHCPSFWRTLCFSNTCQLIYSLLSSTCCDIRHIARTVLREVSKIKDFRGKISRSNVKLGQILKFDHFDLGL